MAIASVQQSHPPVETVLARLKGVRTSLHGWVACCPAHRDREPSLSIGLGDEGQVLLNCFAGCSLDSIVEAMGIAIAELFPKAASASGSQPEQTQRNVLTLVDLALDKLLPWKYLLHLGVTEKHAGCLQTPITCPMAHRRLATGCARHWSPKRDRTGARVQARLFPMDWNAWKKPERRVTSSSWRANPTAGRSGTTTFQPLVCPAWRWYARSKKPILLASTSCISDFIPI